MLRTRWNRSSIARLRARWLSRSDWCHPDRMPTPAIRTANQMPYRPRRAAWAIRHSTMLRTRWNRSSIARLRARWLSRSDWCHPDNMPTPATSTANQMPYRPKRAALGERRGFGTARCCERAGIEAPSRVLARDRDRGGGVSPPAPSHATGRTDPYPAARKVEVTWRASGVRARRSSGLEVRF